MFYPLVPRIFISPKLNSAGLVKKLIVFYSNVSGKNDLCIGV